MSNYKKDQQVIAIDDLGKLPTKKKINSKFTKGEIYVVRSSKTSICACKNELIDVGLLYEDNTMQFCGTCFKQLRVFQKGEIQFSRAARVAPLISDQSISELLEESFAKSGIPKETVKA